MSYCKLRGSGRIALLCAASCLVPANTGLLAQGVTTATVHGTVRTLDGSDPEGALVTVVNGSTGFGFESVVRRGRFVVHGLEVGGPYTISIRRTGYHTEQLEHVFLALGQRLELSFMMRVDAIPLDTLQVLSTTSTQSSADGGTGTRIADSLLHRLPSLNRNLYDFVRLVPQISTRTGFRTGFSGGGAGLRFNNYLINGVADREPYFNAVPEFGAGKSISLEAVKEYRVLLAPYDVRYGDFAGALVNTVTRAGTNRIEGSAFAYARNDRIGRRNGDRSIAPYEQLQYGMTLGGPLRRDRLHFFVAGELQHFTSPAPGPYLGQPTSAGTPVPNAAAVARFEDILRGKGLVAGSGGPVENRNPVANVFARLDFALPAWNSRAILWTNHAHFSTTGFSRSDSFPLSTYRAEQAAAKRGTSVQLQTALRRSGGGHNELIVSHSASTNETLPEVRQPIVRVPVPGTNGGRVTLIAGTHPTAQGMFTRSRAVHLIDNLTLPLGSNHLLTLGIAFEDFRIDKGGVANAFGAWAFSSLDSLDRGEAEHLEVAWDLVGSVPISGTHYAAYAGNRWRAGDGLIVNLGVRAELLAIEGRAPYNPAVDSIFGRRTNARPPRPLHWSPRLGFTWDMGGGRDRLRGGAGIFTGRPPLAWIHAAREHYGNGVGRLVCGTVGTGPPPAFAPDYRTPPASCATGSVAETVPRGDVDLLDRRLQMSRRLRANLAWDRRLPWDVVATGEVFVTRNLADHLFVNVNLEGPQAVDRHGRTLYGSIDTSGVATPALRWHEPQIGVIDLVNTSRGYSYQVSARLEKPFLDGFAATASYTWSRVRDVSTPVRTGLRGIVNWSERMMFGRHDDLRPGISLNDVPHRIVLAGNYRAPWHGWSTDISFFYVGESGSPFTYRTSGSGRRGDLNADGSSGNDPVYVPRSAHDTSEIRFSHIPLEANADHSAAGQAAYARAQQEAFDRFIESTPCLRRQRGRIMERNSCREPWAHTTVASVRQAIPLGARALEAELQIFNLLNLLNRGWGLQRVAPGRYQVADPALLEHVGQTGGPPEVAQPVFRFNPAAPRWTTLPESAFQLQLAVRYRF
jgi:hypothetical protein